MLEIVLARPRELHRNVESLSDLNGFSDEIGSATAAESTAEILSMNLNLRSGQACDLRRDLLCRGLNLRGSPDLRTIRTNVGDCVQRLHGSVRQIRSFVDGFDLF